MSIVQGNLLLLMSTCCLISILQGDQLRLLSMIMIMLILTNDPNDIYSKFGEDFVKAGGLRILLNVLEKDALPMDIDYDIRQSAYLISLQVMVMMIMMIVMMLMMMISPAGRLPVVRPDRSPHGALLPVHHHQQPRDVAHGQTDSAQENRLRLDRWSVRCRQVAPGSVGQQDRPDNVGDCLCRPHLLPDAGGVGGSRGETLPGLHGRPGRAQAGAVLRGPPQPRQLHRLQWVGRERRVDRRPVAARRGLCPAEDNLEVRNEDDDSN